MADLSQIELNNVTYNLKDPVAREEPIATKTYTNVIATANDANGAGFFYMKVRPTSYQQYGEYWHIKTRVTVSVPNNSNYFIITTFNIFGYANTYTYYSCENKLRSTSYRPIYYNSVFFVSETGYNNGCSNWIGINLQSAKENTNSSLARTVKVELLQYENCEVELQDSLITPTNIPKRTAHTNYYTSTNTSYNNFAAHTTGFIQNKDDNTTSISNLYVYGGNYIADSIINRYQLLFTIDENTLTPLTNNNSAATSKTMLTNVEFNPFEQIYYYASSSTINANREVPASSLFWAYGGVDLRFTLNCGSTLTAHKPIYLVVIPTSNGKCKIDGQNPWAQTLPTTNNGKWYILLGRTYSSYQISFYHKHPIYKHNGTKIIECMNPNSTHTYAILA